MKVSLNWVKRYTDIKLPLEELVEKIGAQLGAVDEVVDLGKRYEGIVVVEVLSCQKHPDADKLTVCMVDDRGVVKDVQREPDGHVQIVCGAPNVTEHMLAAWIPPGVTVPSTINKEPFSIEAREIRGTASNGMLASPKELELGDNHEGLLVIDKDVEPGTPFAEVYKLDDQVIDIENKMFTHRPDCFGMLGIAREIAGIQDQPFKSPDWYKLDAELENQSSNELKLAVNNEAQELVPRFCVIAISNVQVGPSPVWLQSKLSRVGVRPINNVVDVTNFMMLASAQPLHAYDYDKVKTGILGIRLSKEGESLSLLGGKELKLRVGDVVITDGEQPIGLGGVMGGADTEVDENTKNIILECGTFEMNQTRQTAMNYGLFTDAATRFTKGQSPLQNIAVLAKAVSEILKVAGGQLASQLVDNHTELLKPKTVDTTAGFINSRLGLNLSSEEMLKLLKNVEFEASASGDDISVTAPFWRTDIEIPEDIVEEIGRLYGYDKLPMVLPTRDLTPAKLDPLLSFKSKIREILSAGGANEVLTYSFVHGSLLEKVGQPADKAYQLRNALSPDLQYYRLSLMPSLLEKIHPNVKLGYDRFALFEIGKAHNKNNPEDGDEKVPKEFNMLALVIAGREKIIPRESGAAFYMAKAYLDYLADKLGVTFKYDAIGSEQDYPVSKPYDYQRSAAVSVAETGAALGMVGEFRQPVVRGLKLPKFSAGFEIGVEELIAGLPKENGYKTLPRFPRVEQDITLKVPAEVRYSQVFELARQAAEELKPKNTIAKLEPLDIFQADAEPDHRNITLRLNISSYERTMTDEEVNKLLDELAKKAAQDLEASRV